MAFTSRLGTSASQPGAIIFGSADATEVSQTITFTQTIANANVINRSVEQTITFSQSLSFSKKNKGDVDAAITFSQTQTCANVFTRAIFDTLVVNHSRIVKISAVKTASNTLTMTSTAVGVRARNVANTLTFSQTQTAVKAKRVSSTITFTQSQNRALVTKRSIGHLYAPFHNILTQKTVRRTVPQTLTLAQAITVFRVKGVSHTLALTQTVVGTRSHSAKDLLVFGETFKVNGTYNKSHENLLTLAQQIDKIHVRSLSATNVFAPNQVVKKQRIQSRTVSSTLTMFSEARRQRYPRTVTSTITFTQSIVVRRFTTQNVSQVLTLASTPVLKSTLSRTISSLFNFGTTHIVPFAGDFITVPNVVVAKSQRFTILRAPNKFVTLPNPEFGDGEGNTGLFTVRRAMNGSIYTYVKNNNTKKLNYTFYLGRQKAFELKEFLKEHHSSPIEMQNWKGELWRVHITNNPFEFTAKSRYGPCDTERYDIDLELEGVKIN